MMSRERGRRPRQEVVDPGWPRRASVPEREFGTPCGGRHVLTAKSSPGGFQEISLVD